VLESAGGSEHFKGLIVKREIEGSGSEDGSHGNKYTGDQYVGLVKDGLGERVPRLGERGERTWVR